MAKSKKVAAPAKKPRVSKEDAVQLFLDATISILKEKAILDITLQDKAELRYSMSFTLINIAASPGAMLCIY